MLGFIAAFLAIANIPIARISVNSIIGRRIRTNPPRERERRMRRFKSSDHAQRILSVHGTIASHFRLGQHRLGTTVYRQQMTERFLTWRTMTGLAA